MSGHVLDVLYVPYATLWRMYYMYLLERNWPSNCLITLGIRVCGRWKFHLPPTWLRCQPFLSLSLSFSPSLSLENYDQLIVHLTNHVQTLSQVRLYLCVCLTLSLFLPSWPTRPAVCIMIYVFHWFFISHHIVYCHNKRFRGVQRIDQRTDQSRQLMLQSIPCRKLASLKIPMKTLWYGYIT